MPLLIVAPLTMKFLIVDNKKQFIFGSRITAECAEVSRQDRIRGVYENKIRFFSPPEKIFETFATVKSP